MRSFLSIWKCLSQNSSGNRLNKYSCKLILANRTLFHFGKWVSSNMYQNCTSLPSTRAKFSLSRSKNFCIVANGRGIFLVSHTTHIVLVWAMPSSLLGFSIDKKALRCTRFFHSSMRIFFMRRVLMASSWLDWPRLSGLKDIRCDLDWIEPVPWLWLQCSSSAIAWRWPCLLLSAAQQRARYNCIIYHQVI